MRRVDKRIRHRELQPCLLTLHNTTRETVEAARTQHEYQARQWFTRALQAEADDDLLSQAVAMAIAKRLMTENKHRCFQVAEKKRAVVAAVQAAGAA